MAAMRETEDSAVCRHPLGVGTKQPLASVFNKF
jgi:hypothetical protein